MKELSTILSMLYAIAFSPEGYVYSHGYFAGIVTSVEERGLIFKTLEGTIKSQKNPFYVEYYKKFKLIDCGSERDFSIDDKSLIPQLKHSMITRQPVFLHYKKVIRLASYWYGDEKTFATGVEVIK